MKLSEKFPYLRHFFACYFHQDWMVEYANGEMAIKGYVDDDGPEDANRVVRELDQLLGLRLPESELDDAMYRELHCYYNPEPSGQSMTEWLQWVRAMLIKYEQLAPREQ